MSRPRRPIPPKGITESMIDAAYQVAALELGLPYGASITNYTDPETGAVDREALRAADQEAERKNRAAIKRVLVAAAKAYESS